MKPPPYSAISIVRRSPGPEARAWRSGRCWRSSTSFGASPALRCSRCSRLIRKSRTGGGATTEAAEASGVSSLFDALDVPLTVCLNAEVYEHYLAHHHGDQRASGLDGWRASPPGCAGRLWLAVADAEAANALLHPRDQRWRDAEGAKADGEQARQQFLTAGELAAQRNRQVGGVRDDDLEQPQ